MKPPSNGAEQTVRRCDRLGTAVHQHKGTRAVGILDRPRCKTCLTKERALLVANHTANSKAYPIKMLCRCYPKHTARIAHLGQERGGEIPGTSKFQIPTYRVD